MCVTITLDCTPNKQFELNTLRSLSTVEILSIYFDKLGKMEPSNCLSVKITFTYKFELNEPKTKREREHIIISKIRMYIQFCFALSVYVLVKIVCIYWVAHQIDSSSMTCHFFSSISVSSYHLKSRIPIYLNVLDVLVDALFVHLAV